MKIQGTPEEMEQAKNWWTFHTVVWVGNCVALCRA